MAEWYEFGSPGESATTHIALVYEDGSVYLPEGPDVASETDFRLAAATDRFWRLVRKGEAETERDEMEKLVKEQGAQLRRVIAERDALAARIARGGEDDG